MLKFKCLSTEVGCHVGETVVNNLNFADDIALMTTSITALKSLLKICESYASEHSIIFNPKKTICQAFVPRYFDPLPPEVSLCGQKLSWSDNVRYLGFDMSCWERDTSEMMRRRRDLYVRASLIASRFHRCSTTVKKYLFSTYFGSMYCMSLWVPTDKKIIGKVKVEYNDAFRSLFKMSRRSSASEMFCNFGVLDFNAVRRRAAFSLLQRVATSENHLVSSIYNSHFFTHSSIYKTWCNILLPSNHDSDDFFSVFNESLIV